MSDGCAWIDSDYVPVGEARIPILDTGFIRSDLTYDVVGVWEGRFFRLDDHLDRLEQGCRTIHLQLPLPREQIREIAIGVVRRSGLQNAYVSMIATRGVPAPGERDPRLIRPRFYAYAIPYVWIWRPDGQAAGADLVIARDVRRIPSDSIDPTVKNFQWGDFIRGQFEAYGRGPGLAILTDGEGNVTEGGGFNLFAVVDGSLRTPVHGVLEGVTRRTVLEIAAEDGIGVDVDVLPLTALAGADELFITSTAGGVMPVATLDGVPVGKSCPGPITTGIHETYWAWHRDPRFTVPVDYGA